MPRHFNTAGPCHPAKHYMLPPERRLPGVDALIDSESYFVVHAPRQTGKTTTLATIARRLREEGRYAAVVASCEAGQAAGDDLEQGLSAVLRSIEESSRGLAPEARPEPLAKLAEIEPSSRLRVYLRRWSERSPLPVALFLDEIDALFGRVLVSVLRQLRSGLIDRPSSFPQSIALIGLRDVRDYRLADEDTLGTSSPFNIKVESLTLRDFTAEEVDELYGQHIAETGQSITREARQRAFELTRGQPWLVNALAREGLAEAGDTASAVGVEQIEAAKERFILRRDTHLDSLIDRLREPRVQRILEPVLTGQLVSPDTLDDDLHFVLDLGLVVLGQQGLEIANPIYQEVIPRALSWMTQSTLPVQSADFVDASGVLDIERLLAGFRAFWCEHAELYLDRQPYHEAAAQLVFMAYLQRVVNGGGFVDREYGVGRGRIDLHIRWQGPEGLERWGVELKIHRPNAPDPLSSGLDQLAGYLDRLSLDRGVLVIFDQRPDAPPLPGRAKQEPRQHRGKTLTVLWL